MSENKKDTLKNAQSPRENEEKDKNTPPPMGFRMIAREFTKDKMALGSLVLIGIILLVVFIGAMLIDQTAMERINILNSWNPPSPEHWLGTDDGGRDVLQLIIIGARNSISIAVLTTLGINLVGITFGVISGYFGGRIDNVLMRFADFIMILPGMVIIIVVVTVIPNWNVFWFVTIFTLVFWTGTSRLFRALALTEARRDYVSASKTLGTPTWKIIFREVLPNLSSVIITNLTIALAGNMGIEVTLTFLGFGLPPSIPSLGRLINHASNGAVLQNNTWVWMPPALLIVIWMLCVNYIGAAFKRAADARQRLG